jgi:hypothetical protein
MIYFLQPFDGGPIKIGFSTDVARRRCELEKVYRCRLNLLATREGDEAEERSIHERFDHLRLGRTEQFSPGPDLIAFLGLPLLVGANPDAVEPIDSDRESVIHMKGSRAYVEWVEKVHNKTHIPKVQIFRIAARLWAEQNGHPAPPEI